MEIQTFLDPPNKEMPNLQRLAMLNARSFAVQLPGILRFIMTRSYQLQFGESDSHLSNTISLVLSRASEPPVITALTSILERSLKNEEHKDTCWSIFSNILKKLPERELESYRHT